MSQNSPDKRFALAVRYDPIEEVALSGAEDACGFNAAPRARAAGCHREGRARQRDRLRDDYQKGMLKEQRVALHFPAVDQLQKLRPQLPL